MKHALRAATAAFAIATVFAVVPDPAFAQVDGFSSCQQTFDVNPETPAPSSGSCNVTGVVFLGQGQQTFFDVVGSAQAFEGFGTDVYDVQLTLSASGDYPDGFLFGQAEVRSTNGDVCNLELFSGFDGKTCEGMFSSDGIFTVFVDALSGFLPG